MKLKRIEPGYYQGILNGKRICIYKVTARGIDGGRNTGWNLQIDGRVVSDWLPSCKQALSNFIRFHAA